MTKTPLGVPTAAAEDFLDNPQGSVQELENETVELFVRRWIGLCLQGTKQTGRHGDQHDQADEEHHPFDNNSQFHGPHPIRRNAWLAIPINSNFPFGLRSVA